MAISSSPTAQEEEEEEEEGAPGGGGGRPSDACPPLPRPPGLQQQTKKQLQAATKKHRSSQTSDCKHITLGITPPNPDAFVDQVLRGQPSGARAMTASFPKQLFCVTSFPKTVTKTFVQLTRSEHTHRARVQCATSWSMRSWKKTTTGRFILLDHGAQSPGPSTGNGTATSFICFLLLCGWLFGWLVAGCLGGVGGSLGLARPSPHPPAPTRAVSGAQLLDFGGKLPWECTTYFCVF